MTLDAEQLAAVQASDRLVRVPAGAGTGKTLTLIGRIRYLVEQVGVHPSAIAAITFAKKATEELVRRLPVSCVGAHISTIHSLCFTILAKERRGRGIAEEAVRRRLIREALIELEKLKVPRLPAASECYSMISHVKARGWAYPDRFKAIGVRYSELLREHDLYDMDDLILAAVALFDEHPEVAARWAHRFKDLLVDEGQDTSELQWRALQYLVGPTTRMFVCGDVRQSMYRFRGAQPERMLDLDERFGGTFVDYPITTNYRSLGQIVTAANGISEQMLGTYPLQAARRPVETPVVHALPMLVEARDTTALLGRILQYEHETQGVPWSDMAVLYRVNANAEALETSLSLQGIPYVVVGGMGFYGRSEVKDVLAYLALSQGDDADAFKRVYNRPSRYLGKVWLGEVEQQGGWSVLMARRLRFSRPYMSRRAEELVNAVRDLRNRSDAPPQELVAFVRDELGYQDWLVGEEPDLQDEVVIENLQALEEGAARWDNVPDFLAFAGVCQQKARTDDPTGALLKIVDRVQLSTVHRAKGLEWPVVVVHGLAVDVFPHKRGDADEERRILYVAVTRARDRLYFTTMKGPSEFYYVLAEHSDLAVPAPPGLPCSQPLGNGAWRRGARDVADDGAVGGRPGLEPDGVAGGAHGELGSHGGDSERDLGGVSVDLAAARVGGPAPAERT